MPIHLLLTCVSLSYSLGCLLAMLGNTFSSTSCCFVSFIHMEVAFLENMGARGNGRLTSCMWLFCRSDFAFGYFSDVVITDV